MFLIKMGKSVKVCSASISPTGERLLTVAMSSYKEPDIHHTLQFSHPLSFMLEIRNAVVVKTLSEALQIASSPVLIHYI